MIIAPRCRHIKTNGLTCKSPALQGKPRCFFHQRQMLRHARFNSFSNPPGLSKPGQHLPLIAVEDHDSIQLALSLVINGLAIGHLEPLRAKALLYGLQIASINAKNIGTEPSNRYDLVLEIETDAVGDDLAQPGDAVDITHPSVQQREEDERIRAARARIKDDEDEDEDDDDEDEEEEDDDDDYDEDDEDEDDDDDEEDEDDDEDDEEEEDDDDDREDDENGQDGEEDAADEADDLRVFNEVNEFMRLYP